MYCCDDELVMLTPNVQIKFLFCSDLKKRFIRNVSLVSRVATVNKYVHFISLMGKGTFSIGSHSYYYSANFLPYLFYGAFFEG